MDRQFRYEPGAPGASLPADTLARFREVFEAVAVADGDTLSTLGAFQRGASSPINILPPSLGLYLYLPRPLCIPI